MRISFENLDRPRAAARLLVRGQDIIRLSDAQNSLARATGYRDWSDLRHAARSAGNAPVALPDAADIIIAIGEALDLDTGRVHYAISRSRLLGIERSVSAMLALRASIWRKQLFGAPARGRAGSIVRVRGWPADDLAYLKSMGRPATLVFDNGLGSAADFEVITPRVTPKDFVPSRLWLPYGYWTLGNGAIVTFSRDYKPLWQVTQDRVERPEPWLWIRGIADQTHFAALAGSPDWSRGSARELALRHLSQNRLFDPPRLLDAMPLVFRPSVNSVSGAVEMMESESRRIGPDWKRPPEMAAE